jgi:hypothetical protein
MNVKAGVWCTVVIVLGMTATDRAAGVELSEGIVVDPAEGRIYLMSPERTVEAVNVADGKILWRSREAAKPLALSAGVLVAQAEPRAADNTLRFVMLDSRQGKRLRTATQELPGVEVRIDDGLTSRFDARAVSVDDTSFIAWESQVMPLRGMPPPPTEEQEPGQPPPEGARPAPRQTEGTLRLEVRTGRVARVAKSAAPPGARTAQPVALTAAPGEPADPMQRLSADGRHLLKSRQIDDDSVWEKYEWTIVDVGSGGSAGKHRSPWSQVPFVVVDKRLIYETAPFQRRTGAEMITQGPMVRVADLTSGKELWARPVRDTSYRGPFPP